MKIETVDQTDQANWEKWSNYCPYDSPPANWCIKHLSVRNSGELLPESNMAAVEKAFAPFFADGTAEKITEGSSLVGPIDGVAFAVVLNGRLAPVAEVWNTLARRYQQYPILDDEDYSNRELDACEEYIAGELTRCGYSGADEGKLDAACSVYRWLSDNGYDSELENIDDTGAAPSDDAITEALQGLVLWANPTEEP